MRLYFKLQYFSHICLNYYHLHFLHYLMKKMIMDTIFYTCLWGFFLFHSQKIFLNSWSFTCIYKVLVSLCYNHTVHTQHTQHNTKERTKKAKGARKKQNKTSRGISKNSSYNQKEIVNCLCSSSLRWTKVQYL